MKWLKAIREERNLTQEEVAKKIGASQPTYCNIESGVRQPSVKMAKQIGVALGFDWTRFFEDSHIGLDTGRDSA